MRTEEINIYKYEELSGSAKEKAREWFLSGSDYPWEDETRESLEKFCKVFDITLKDWSYGGNNDYIKADLNIPDSVEFLSGVRLYKYIVNNFDNMFALLKYKKRWGLTIPGYVTAISHEMRKRKEYKTKTGKKWISKITFVETDCPFTGYCMDDTLLQPIRDFIKSPSSFKNWTLEDLLTDCLNEWLKAARSDYEYCRSAEYAEESIIINEYEFTADGNIY